MRENVKRRIKSAGREVVCTALAAVMCVALFPAQAMAAGGNKYVSELSMAYGSNAKAELESAGYTVIDQDLNVGTGKKDVFMGYKTTANPSEAITDVAVMYMNGGYSFSDYQEMLNNRRDSVDVQVQSIWSAVKELRAAKEKGVKGIDSVIESMNMFWEDDTDQGMGDFMLKCTSKELTNVLLQSNEVATASLQQLLSQGIATDWASKLADVDPDGDFSGADADDAADVLRAQITYIRKQVIAFEKQGLTDEALQEMEESIDESDAAAGEYTAACIDDATYMALENTAYGDGTLLDLVKTKPANLTADMCLPIVAQMTKGQRELLPNAGFQQLLMNSLSCNSSATEKAMGEIQDAAGQMFEITAQSEEAMEGMTEEEVAAIEAKHVSMYEGVNRELFTDSVALTNDALRKEATTGDTSMFFNNTASRIIYGVAAVVASAAAIGLITWAVKAYKVSKTFKLCDAAIQAYDAVLGTGNWFEASRGIIGAQDAAAANCTLGMTVGILAGIALILAGIAVGIDLYNYYHPDYKEIPSMIVDQTDETDEDGKLTTTYVNYSVVRLATANDKGVYEAADTNGFKGLQWNAVYTTKDTSVGNPILADSLTAQVGSSTAVDTDSVGFHAFGDTTAAYDLNAHSYKNDKHGVYLFFQRDITSVAGSTFGTGYLFLSAGVGLLVGVAITLAATSANRRRRETATA